MRESDALDAHGGTGEPPAATRRSFLAAAGGAAAAGLAGCIGGDEDGGPTVRLLSIEGYDRRGLLDAVESHADAQVEIGRSASSRILESWRDGTAAEDWDAAVLQSPYLGDLVASGTTASVPDDLEHAGGMREVFDRAREGSLAVDGEGRGLPIAADWTGYGFDAETVGDHEVSWSTLFSDAIGGTDLSGSVLMPQDEVVSILATAAHLGYGGVFDGEEWALSDDQRDAIRAAATDQYPLVYDYTANPVRDWRRFADAVEVGLVPLSATIDARAEGEAWADYATPSNAPITALDGVVVSPQADDPEAAWRVADAFTHPEVGAAIGRYHRGVGVHPDVGDHVGDFVADGQFEQAAADFVASLGDAAFDRLRLPRPVAGPEAWDALWTEVRDGAPDLPGDA